MMASQKQSSARRRIACDRCHSFKLKCPRSSLKNDDACARCLKAGVHCSYSPSMRGQVRPKQSTPFTTGGSIPVDSLSKGFDNGVTIPTFDAHDDFFDGLVMDWTVHENSLLQGTPDLLFQVQPPATDDATVSSDDLVKMPSQDHAGRSSNNIISNHIEENHIRIMEHEPIQRPRHSLQYLGFPVPDGLQSPDVFLQLTHLMVTLENLARQLPSFSVHDEAMKRNSTQPGSSTPSNNASDTSNTDYESDFEVGKTYAITHKLADIYIPLIEQARQRKKLGRNKVFDPYGKPMSSVDQSLLLLLCSCHNRLIDLWHSMLVHARKVQDPDIYSADAIKEHKARCAHFTMGPYEASSSSTVVDMGIIILQELAMHLANRLKNLIGVIDSEEEEEEAIIPQSNEVEEMSGDLQSIRSMVLTAKALHLRALGMRRDISQLRSILEGAIST